MAAVEDKIRHIAEVHVVGPRPRKFTPALFCDIRPNLNEEWLIDDIMPGQGAMFVYGGPEGGKSFLVLDACLHVAAGLDYAGKQVMRRGVAYFAAEGGIGFNKRVAAARLGREYPSDLPFALFSDTPLLGTKESDAPALIHDVDLLNAHFRDRVGVVVLDTLNKISAGTDENSASEMGVLIENAEKIAKALRCLVIIIHHDGKDTDRGMRGSGALRGGSDAIWKVVADGAARSVKVERMKEGPSAIEWTFSLTAVEVGTSTRGKPVTSCYVEIQDAPRFAEHSGTLKVKPLTGHRAAVMQAVERALSDAGETAPPSSTIPAGTIVVTREKIKLFAEKMGFADPSKPDSWKAQFNRELRVLKGDKRLDIWGDFVWKP